MRILKFKSQLTIAFFAAMNHLNGPLRKQYFTLTGSKGHGLWFVIGFVCFCVSRFVACDRNYDWRQQKIQLWRRPLNFRVRMFVKSTVMTLIIKDEREFDHQIIPCSKRESNSQLKTGNSNHWATGYSMALSPLMSLFSYILYVFLVF